MVDGTIILLAYLILFTLPLAVGVGIVELALKFRNRNDFRSRSFRLYRGEL